MILKTRTRNTTTHSSSFDLATVQAVWEKGQTVAGYNPNLYRKDACGAWVHRWSYGQTTQCGWEVDHVRPVAGGGTDHLTNLQPLQWQNNRHKADNWPNWTCAVQAA